MKLPNSINSYIIKEKLSKYLLNFNHDVGKSKALYFSKFGFNIKNIDDFEKSLLQHSIDREIFSTSEDTFGINYKLKCNINNPDNRNPCIITIWIIEHNSNTPRFITAYPAG